MTLVEGDRNAQIRQVFENLRAAVEVAALPVIPAKSLPLRRQGRESRESIPRS